jgi:hypothetical protein
MLMIQGNKIINICFANYSKLHSALQLVAWLFFAHLSWFHYVAVTNICTEKFMTHWFKAFFQVYSGQCLSFCLHILFHVSLVVVECEQEIERRWWCCWLWFIENIFSLSFDVVKFDNIRMMQERLDIDTFYLLSQFNFVLS